MVNIEEEMMKAVVTSYLALLLRLLFYFTFEIRSKFRSNFAEKFIKKEKNAIIRRKRLNLRRLSI